MGKAGTKAGRKRIVGDEKRAKNEVHTVNVANGGSLLRNTLVQQANKGAVCGHFDPSILYCVVQ